MLERPNAAKQPGLRAGAAVRLVLEFEGVPEGSTGTIIGFFTFPEPATCLVRFDGEAKDDAEAKDVAIRVPADDLEPI